MTRFSGSIKNNAEHTGSTARIKFIAVLFLVLAAVFLSRLFYLQVFKHGLYKTMAIAQHENTQKLLPARGMIYAVDKDGREFCIADNQDLYLLFAVPVEIDNATLTVEKIVSVLNMEEQEKVKVLNQLKKNNDPYEPLKHYLNEEEKNKLKDLNIVGLGFSKETKRYYPEGDVFAHLNGFVGFSEDKAMGQYGLEEFFETELRGKNGMLKSETDPAGHLIAVGEYDVVPAEGGSSLYLNIDPVVQLKACETLKKAVKNYEAQGGVVIIQNPNDGAILALCVEPSFDPNNYGQVENVNFFINQAISSLYEPGSIFKPITMAVALDTQSVEPDTTYEDKGILVYGKDKITNAMDKKYGVVNMTQVLENSINTGAVFAAVATGRENMKKYISDFGFGAHLGIDLPREAKGDVNSLDKKSDIYLATASFGQGIAVTPLQMINAFSAIANGGILYKPWVVKKIVKVDGEVEEFTAQQIRRVISSKSANVLKAMLVSVVKNGHSGVAKIPGYFVAGKTGTAQIPAKNGGYLNAYNHSFVGFAPATKPRFTLFVKITNPAKGAFAESTAGPVFAEIMKYLLNYYQVPTDE